MAPSDSKNNSDDTKSMSLDPQLKADFSAADEIVASAGRSTSTTLSGLMPESEPATCENRDNAMNLEAKNITADDISESTGC
jgi:hypothetical protein